MVSTQYNTDYFAITGGATGSFYFSPQPGRDVLYARDNGPVYGTFNGQQVTAISSFGNPLNATGNLTEGTSPSYISSQGIVADTGPGGNGKNGLSLKLADGSSVRFYVVVDGGGGTSLAYETSTGESGPIAFSYHRDTQVFGCFVGGTRIATPAGEAEVETLRAGDLVTVASGAERAVKWLGHAVGWPLRHPRPAEVMPIRIVAGAFGPDMPVRDLRVSPGHALLVGGTLVNAGELVNAATIVQEETELVHYYHVELDSHDLLIADGMPCESYLDDGNRASFLEGDAQLRLNGRIDPADAAPRCLPLIKDGPQLATARAMLLARAEELGWRREERPELRLDLAGVPLPPAATAGRRYWFVLPGGHDGAVRLRSSSAAPSRVEFASEDGRRLGVAIGELRIDGEPCDLAASRFGAGFYPPEDDGHTPWRWTDGNASLSISTATRVIEIKLQIVMPVLCREAAAAEQAAGRAGAA